MYMRNSVTIRLLDCQAISSLNIRPTYSYIGIVTPLVPKNELKYEHIDCTFSRGRSDGEKEDWNRRHISSFRYKIHGSGLNVLNVELCTQKTMYNCAVRPNVLQQAQVCTVKINFRFVAIFKLKIRESIIQIHIMRFFVSFYGNIYDTFLYLAAANH